MKEQDFVNALGEVFGETYCEFVKDYMERMKKEGYKIVLPKPNELQIDLDTEEQIEVFERQWTILERTKIGVTKSEFTPSKGGPPGVHVTVTLPFDVNDIERIAFQAALGSDPIRELLSVFRYKAEINPISMFVEK